MIDPPHPESASPQSRLTDTPRGQTIFVALWVFGTVIVLGLWVGAFLWGTQQGDGRESPLQPEAAAAAPELLVLGGLPQTAGTWDWFELRGGECISGFSDAFAEKFQVVSCTSPHNAQLIHAELLSDSLAEPYPGDAPVVAMARDLCDVRELVKREVAEEFSDLRTSYSYPVNQVQWDAGERAVYCFVFSASGQTLQQSLR